MVHGKALLAITASILVACSDYGDRPLDPTDYAGQRSVPVTLTVNATKGQTASTRGLTLNNDKIAAIWSASDRVTVLSATNTMLGTMTPMSTGSRETKLKAELSDYSSVSINDQLNLVFPRTGRDYTGQIGTLEDIAAKYDYATASVKVTYVDDSFVSASDAHFVNQQAIVKFSLQKPDGSALMANSLTIAADGLIQKGETQGPVTITPTAAKNEIYAALTGFEEKAVTLTATVGKKTYSYITPEAKTLKNGNYYLVNCKMQADPVAYTQPLTLECFDTKGCAVSVTNYGDLEYYTNSDKKWIPYEGDQIDLSNGDWVSFRGTNATQTQSTDYMQIYSNGSCYVYGNIMSLLSKDSYATLTDLPYENTFSQLFYNNKNLTHIEGKDLVLPATTLVPGCYLEMFSGCSNLNYVKCLATDISADNCTFEWLKGAGSYILSESGTCTFIQAAGVNWPRNDDSGIPVEWDVKTE